MVRAPASQLGDPGLNLGSANNSWLGWGPHKYSIRAPVSKLGGETPNQIRVWSCRSVTKNTFSLENMTDSAIYWTLSKPIALDEKLPYGGKDRA